MGGTYPTLCPVSTSKLSLHFDQVAHKPEDRKEKKNLMTARPPGRDTDTRRGKPLIDGERSQLTDQNRLVQLQRSSLRSLDL